MKEITKLMINEFKIKKLGYDFMGYKLQKDKSLTFHHLIIPRRNNGPETRWNGAIIQRIPQDYLHIIEEKNAETLNKKGKILIKEDYIKGRAKI